MRKKYGKRNIMIPMLRWATAGESHNKAPVALIGGVPAGLPLATDNVSRHLAHRRLGYGRGARMKFEADEVTLLTDIRHGETLGAPIGIMVGNSERPKWAEVINTGPVNPAALSTARDATLAHPHPGHADFNDMLRYNHTDTRNILEYSPARGTVARAAASIVARSILRETLDAGVVDHVISADRSEPYGGPLPTFADQDKIGESPVRAFSAVAGESMIAEIRAAKKQGDTLGDIVKIIIHGLPVDLESHISGDARPDSQLTGALMGIQSAKGMEIGDGFKEAHRRDTEAHGEMVRTDDGVDRETSRAGGLEGSVASTQPLVVRTAMKPILTVPHALKTVDMANGNAATAIYQRSGVYTVPADGAVTEAMVAPVLARAVVERFGGDSLEETKRNVEDYLERTRRRPD